MLNELKKKHPSLQVIKKYPESGQKIVYLVNVEDYGEIILKIVKKMNERISREIDIMRNAGIPGVPRIFYLSSFCFEDNEYTYFFEEYIEGESLKEKLSRNGKLSVVESIKLLNDLLLVVVKLEELRIVHRDIKPDNIICDKDGNFHLIDFGIARNLNLTSLTYTHVAACPHTPGYAAPELFQYNKKKIDSRADLFSIGVVVYEAIFGKNPFIDGGEVDVNEIWYKTVTVIPENHDIPGDTDSQLIGLIQTMMKKTVTLRPPTAKKAYEWYKAVLTTLSI